MNRAEAVAELKAVWAALSADQDAAVAYGKESNTPYAQRALIRASFALMEGLSYQLRAVTLASLQSTEFLAESEVALLREERYTIDEKGMPQTQESFLRFPESLLFSIRMYARNHGAAFEPDVKSSGWQAMRKAAKVRNRVTHPKSAASLELSDQDLTAIQEAAAWWKATMLSMFAACSEADQYWLEQLRNEEA